MATVLVTGAAGFIGYHTSERLLARGHRVIGLDSVNGYYEPALKWARVERLRRHAAFAFHHQDLVDGPALDALFAERIDRVVHLAAQPGVRHSLEAPHDYVQANVVGFLNVLEACRHHGVEHLLYASTSSVYGANTKMPFSEHDPINHPLSLYAATKKANELMAHSYSHLFGLPTTGLRFFTVYGPWGRPDMALFRFLRAMLADEPIPLFNRGDMARDFTYVDDIAEGVVRLLFHTAAPDPDFDAGAPDPATSAAPWRVYNIGNSQPVPLMDYVAALEKAVGKVAKKELLPMQPGDFHRSWADTSELEAAVGYRPDTPVEEGVARFVAWYRDYYGV